MMILSIIYSIALKKTKHKMLNKKTDPPPAPPVPGVEISINSLETSKNITHIPP